MKPRDQNSTNSVDVLALKLGEELREALLISLNADGVEDLLDVSTRRGGVATDLEEEVCSNITHLQKFKQLRKFAVHETTT